MSSQDQLEFLPRDPELSISLNAKADGLSSQDEAGGQEPDTFDHLFEIDHIDALNAALACNRPLLLTGEPGVGKTQLARAAAAVLKRAFVRYTVDSRTESRDLLWEFDAVARLAEAQAASASGKEGSQLEEAMKVENFLRPGPLWWGFKWQTAKDCTATKPPVQFDGGNPDEGVVVLIDEIDKAEIDVPNGLLEALGDGSFQPDGNVPPVRMGAIKPLIVITSNRERTLPDAFLRRCLELHMGLPKEEEALKLHLVQRGRAHQPLLDDEALEQAADMLSEDRQAAAEAKRHPLPGLAEYLDLLRATSELCQRQGEQAGAVLQRVRRYILRKGSHKA